jgi:hypothetical protein
MKNTFAIFCNEQSDELDIVYNYIIQKYMGDIFIVSDDTTTSFKKHYAILYSFYLCFYKGTIIFLNIEDYLSNKINTENNEVYLICDVKDIIEAGIDKGSLNNVKLLKIENDEVVGL